MIERLRSIAEREAVLAERDRLREAYRSLQLEIELMRRRMFVAKAERIDTAQLELEFAGKLAALDALAQKLGDPEAGADDSSPGARDGRGAKKPGKAKPKGRRDLSGLDLPEERVEIPDPSLEGVARRIGFEESYRLAWRLRPPGHRSHQVSCRGDVVADEVTPGIETVTATIETAPMLQLFPRAPCRSLDDRPHRH